MSANTFAYRRLTNPLRVPVDATATQYTVPADFFGPKLSRLYTTFELTNPNPFWVRLRGTTPPDDESAPLPPISICTEQTGWLFPPGFKRVYSSQYPLYMSALAVECCGLRPGWGFVYDDDAGEFVYQEVGFKPLELAYGNGV